MKRQATAILLPMEASNELAIDVCNAYKEQQESLERNGLVTPSFVTNGNGLLKSITGEIAFVTNHPYNIIEWQAQQLIIVDSREIKVGLPYMMDMDGEWFLMNPCEDQAEADRCNKDHNISKLCKAITCAYPLIENIPPISPSFIKAFADGNGKGEVWVEYTTDHIEEYGEDRDPRGEPEDYGPESEPYVQQDANGFAVLEFLEQMTSVDVGNSEKKEMEFSVECTVKTMYEVLKFQNQKIIDVATSIINRCNVLGKPDVCVSRTGETEMLLYRLDNDGAYRNVIIDEDCEVEYVYVPTEREKTFRKDYKNVNANTIEEIANNMCGINKKDESNSVNESKTTNDDAALLAYKRSMEEVEAGNLSLLHRDYFRNGYYAAYQDFLKANVTTANIISRVEVIGNGREYVNMNTGKVELSYQDDGRTLKLFLEKGKEGRQAVSGGGDSVEFGKWLAKEGYKASESDEDKWISKDYFGFSTNDLYEIFKAKK